MDESNIKSKIKELEKITIGELVNIQVNNAIMKHGPFVDNNHFLGVIYEEIKEVIESVEIVQKDYKNLEEEIFEESLHGSSLVLTDLSDICETAILELSQVMGCIKKYQKCYKNFEKYKKLLKTKKTIFY